MATNNNGEDRRIGITTGNEDEPRTPATPDAFLSIHWALRLISSVLSLWGRIRDVVVALCGRIRGHDDQTQEGQTQAFLVDVPEDEAAQAQRSSFISRIHAFFRRRASPPDSSAPPEAHQAQSPSILSRILAFCRSRDEAVAPVVWPELMETGNDAIRFAIVTIFLFINSKKLGFQSQKVEIPFADYFLPTLGMYTCFLLVPQMFRSETLRKIFHSMALICGILAIAEAVLAVENEVPAFFGSTIFISMIVIGITKLIDYIVM